MTTFQRQQMNSMARMGLMNRCCFKHVITLFIFSFCLAFRTIADPYIQTSDFSDCNASVNKQIVIADYASGTYTYIKDGIGSGTSVGTLSTIPGFTSLRKFTLTMTPGSFEFFRGETSIGTIVFTQSSGSIGISTNGVPPQGCSGTITLIPTGGSGYIWTKNGGPLPNNITPNLTTKAIIVPFEPGVTNAYEVSGTESTCGSSSSASIDVEGQHAVSGASISGDISERFYDDTEDTQFTGSGSNIVGRTWSITGAGSSTISSTGKVTWDNTFEEGTATITFSVTGACSSTDSDVVTVLIRKKEGIVNTDPQGFCSDDLPRAFQIAFTDYCSTCTYTYDDGIGGTNTATVTEAPSSGNGIFTTTPLGAGTHRVYSNGIEITGALEVVSNSAGSIGINLNGTVPFGCDGQTITLEPQGGSGYTWTKNGGSLPGDIVPDPTTKAITVPFEAGTINTYEVTGIEEFCGEELSASIDVEGDNIVTTASISGGNSVQFKGVETTQFTGFASNWTGFSWSISNAGSSTISNTGLVSWDANYVSPSETDKAIVTYTATGNCGSSVSASKSIYVRERESLITEEQSYCSNDLPRTFEVAFSNYCSTCTYTYDAVGSTNTATVTEVHSTGNGIFTTTPLPAGTYKIYSNGVALAESLVITTKAAGSIGIDIDRDDPFGCVGEFITLEPKGGSGYTWTRNGVALPNNITPDPVTSAITVPFVEGTIVTYEVTGNEDACGLSLSASVPVEGDNVVKNATLSGPNDVCHGTESSIFTFDADYDIHSDGWLWSTDPVGAAQSFEVIEAGQVRLTWDPSFVISGASDIVEVIGTARGNCESESVATKNVNYYQPKAYTLAGGGETCSVSDTHEIRLLQADDNVTYRLYREGNPTALYEIIYNDPDPEVDDDQIDFGDFSNEGTYYVEASIGSCSALRMANDVTIEQLVHGTVSASIQLSGFTNPVTSGDPYYTCSATDAYSLTHNYSGFSANWQWYVNGVAVTDSEDEVSISPTQDGIYTIQYSNVNITANCRTIDDLNDPVTPALHFENATDLIDIDYSYSVCDLVRENEITGVPSDYQVNWYETQSLSSFLGTGPSYDFSALDVGSHEFHVRLESEVYGCLSANSATITVEINEPIINITFPVENDIVWREDAYEITWTHDFVPNTSEVNFYLVRDGQSIAIPDPVNWTIAADQALEIDYRIKASICGYDFYSDYFRIGDPFPRELITPEDMILVLQGANELISWTEDSEHHFNIYHAPLNDPTDRIELDPSGSYTSATGVSSLDWIVENTILGDRLVIVEEDQELWAFEANVEIIEPLDIVTPNTTTVYGLGERMQITWDGGSVKLNRPVTISLKWYDMDTEEEMGTDVVSAIKKSGRHYEWVVDPTLSEDYKYKIHLSQEMQPIGQTPKETITDESTEFFLVQDCPNAPKVANLDYNYIKTYTPRIALSGCVSSQDDASKVQESIQFFDGLGRAEQAVVRQFTADERDLVTQSTYDASGRQVKTYLPFKSASNEGLYVSDWEMPQKNFYDPYGERDHAFSERVFEATPLSRPLAVAAPGEVWGKDHETPHLVDFAYRTNVADEVRKVQVVGDNMINQSTSIYYDPNVLYVKTTTDENEGDKEGEIIEFTDKNGRVILKKVKVDSDAVTEVTTYASTFYVYDDFDNLRFVIQPEGIKRLEEGEFSWNQLDDETLLSRWVFAYKYDHRQRMIAKRVPGSDWVFMVYDKRDRLVLTQDGNQRVYETLSDGENISAYKGKSYYVPSGNVSLSAGFHVAASATSSFKITTDKDGIEQDWLYTKYDQLNRPVLTGKVTLTGDNNDQQSEVDTWVGPMAETRSATYDQSFGGYTNASFPTQVTDADLLTASYYDDYHFLPVDELDTDDDIETDVKGLSTGSITKVLGSTEELLSVQYYDLKLRPLKTYSQNIFDMSGSNGSDEVELTYETEVSPLVVQSDVKHAGPQGTYHIRESTTYDQMSRPKVMKHQFGPIGSLGSEVVTASNTYNDLGQLISKNLGGTAAPVQKVDYKYNIRGWLTDMNHGDGLYDANDKFVMQLNYQEASTDYAPNYNGNISEMMWQTVGGNGNQPTTEQRFRYTYDAMNRMSSGTYVGGSGDGAFDVGNLTYDHNGNIESLTRKQFVEVTPSSGPAAFATYEIDQLAYVYPNGNQLSKVTDAGATTFIDATDHERGRVKDIGFKDGANLDAEYIYDDNGNMIADHNKGISSVTYNHLNLPERVVTAEAEITYVYDAMGTKLQKEVVSGGSSAIYTYVGGIHYTKETSGVHELEFLQHSEGRILNTDGAFDYEYNLTDHLGNVRVTVNESGSVIQRNDYYPFGLSFNHYNQSSVGGGENLYQYSGKEHQPETGWLDYGARMYQPDLGRWFNIDPMADAYASYSPYNHVLNDPINTKDVNGEWTVSIHSDLTYRALTKVGIGGEQARLIAHYSSVYADNPSLGVQIGNNIVSPLWQVYRFGGVDYSGTVNSQITDWHPVGNAGSFNNNIRHSMRSPQEREFGHISEEGAMHRGMSYGWDNVFASAKEGHLKDFKKNSKGIQQFGVGIHALQDAYAHKGTDMDNHSVLNDIFGNLEDARHMSNSAVTVHKLLSGDWGGLGDKVNITTEGMSEKQFNQIMSKINEYLNQKKKEDEDDE